MYRMTISTAPTTIPAKERYMYGKLLEPVNIFTGNSLVYSATCPNDHLHIQTICLSRRVTPSPEHYNMQCIGHSTCLNRPLVNCKLRPCFSVPKPILILFIETSDHSEVISRGIITPHHKSRLLFKTSIAINVSTIFNHTSFASPCGDTFFKNPLIRRL